MKHDLQRALANLASDFDGPAGPIPLERLLRKHHRLLVDLRASGLTWEQISRLLVGAGVVHRNNRAFSPSQLRGVFGRHRKRLLTGSPRAMAASGTCLTDGSLHRHGHCERARTTARQQRPNIATSVMIVDANHTGPNTSPPAACSMPADVSLNRSEDEHNDVAEMRASPASDRARVLALMRRSAMARRLSK